MRLLLVTIYIIIISASNGNAESSVQSIAIPQPPPLSGQDSTIFSEALKAVDLGKYSKAISLADQIEDQVSRKTLIWLIYTEPYSFPAFEKISNFIISNPEWPRQNLLLKTADRALAVKADDQTVINWYHWRDPVTKIGRLRLAKALLNIGEIKRAETIIKKSWHYDYYSRKELVAAEKKYRNFLSEGDHIKRLESLLWRNKYKGARDMFRYVNKGHQSLAKARIALRNFKGGVDALISKIPSNLLEDSGLKYERTRWRRVKGKHKPAQQILLDPPDQLIRPKLWWRERKIQARKLLTNGQYTDAYLMAAEHGQMHSSTYSEAEWLAGWIALRFLNDPTLSFKHFTSIYDVVFMPISRARASYWSGKAAQQAGDEDLSITWFQSAAKYCTAFYGQISANILEEKNINKIPCIERHREKKLTKSKLKTDELFGVARRLSFNKRDSIVYEIILHLGETAKNEADFSLINSFTNSIHRPDVSISAAKRGSRNGFHYQQYLFPIPKIPLSMNEQEIELALIYSVARQESQFYNKAVSPAGAKGLMQLMPRTAKAVARQMKIPFRENDLTTKPELNIRLGSQYLSDLITAYNGSYVLAIAAYNAGPGNLQRWFKIIGDPRSNPNIDIIDWIEKIPVNETRNYVQRVIEGLQVYRYLLNNKNIQTNIKFDLNRGIKPTMKN